MKDPSSFTYAFEEFLSITDGAIESLGGKPENNKHLQFRADKAAARGYDALNMDEVTADIEKCASCALCQKCTHKVPGEGSVNPIVMVVGEGPGEWEDKSGRPFVGKAGQYLDSWLAAISLSRETNCYITNVVKCRPENNRDPLPEEIEACSKYLKRQIELLQPRAILALGRYAAHYLSGKEDSMGQLRGRFFNCGGIPAITTYHPSAVLRNPELRSDVWADLKKLAQFLGLETVKKK